MSYSLCWANPTALREHGAGDSCGVNVFQSGQCAGRLTGFCGLPGCLLGRFRHLVAGLSNVACGHVGLLFCSVLQYAVGFPNLGPVVAHAPLNDWHNAAIMPHVPQSQQRCSVGMFWLHVQIFVPGQR